MRHHNSRPPNRIQVYDNATEYPFSWILKKFVVHTRAHGQADGSFRSLVLHFLMPSIVSNLWFETVQNLLLVSELVLQLATCEDHYDDTYAAKVDFIIKCKVYFP